MNTEALRRARFLDALNAARPQAYHEDNASEFVTSLLGSVIARLRRDPRWACIPRVQLEKLLDEVQRRFEEDLAEGLAGCVQLGDVLEHAIAAWDKATAEDIAKR